MKTKITLVMLFVLACTLNVNAQNTQVTTTKETKTFAVTDNNGTKIPYKVTMYNRVKTKMNLAKEDANQTNQMVTESQEYVTKLIFVDNDSDAADDKYLVVRYIQDPSDSFRLEPTMRGFKMIVDNRYVEYILGEGIYYINNQDRDYFVVDEFSSL